MVCFLGNRLEGILALFFVLFLHLEDPLLVNRGLIFLISLGPGVLMLPG